MLPRLFHWLFRRSEGGSVQGSVQCESEKKSVRCEWNGQVYEINGVTNPNEMTRKFAAYAPKAPVCVTCGRILLPGEPASYQTPGLVISTGFPEPLKIEKEGFTHCTRSCSSSLNFCGWVDDEGQIRSPFPDDAPTAEHYVMRTGQPVILGDIADPASVTRALRESKRR